MDSKKLRLLKSLHDDEIRHAKTLIQVYPEVKEMMDMLKTIM